MLFAYYSCTQQPRATKRVAPQVDVVVVGDIAGQAHDHTRADRSLSSSCFWHVRVICLVPLCRGLAHRAMLLADQQSSLLNVKDLRPTDTLKRMKIVFNRDPAQKQLFVDSARASAVMGNCPKSRESFRAGAFLSHALVCHLLIVCCRY